LVWQRSRRVADVNPLLKSPAGRRITTTVAARQVRRRHRIPVIRGTGGFG